MKNEKKLRKFRKLASFGKRQEFIAIEQILNNSFRRPCKNCFSK